MELRHLHYFIGVGEEENVSRAALKLHVSQPALSRQIRDLEEELGFLLLERSAKSVRLTEAGRAFLTEARAVLQRAEDAVKAARAIATGGRGELPVGYAPPLTARRTVSLAEVAREPLITYSRKDYPDAHENLATMFAAIKSKPRIAEEHDSVSSLIAAVEAGNGVAIAPLSLTCTAGPRLKLIPFSPAPAPLVIGAAWVKNGLTAAAERFLKCAKETALKKE